MCVIHVCVYTCTCTHDYICRVASVMVQKSSKGKGQHQKYVITHSNVTLRLVRKLSQFKIPVVPGIICTCICTCTFKVYTCRYMHVVTTCTCSMYVYMYT